MTSQGEGAGCATDVTMASADSEQNAESNHRGVVPNVDETCTMTDVSSKNGVTCNGASHKQTSTLENHNDRLCNGDSEEESECRAIEFAIDEVAVAAVLSRVVDTAAGTNGEFGQLESLPTLKLVSAIRQELGRSVAFRDVGNCRTVAQLTAVIVHAPVVGRYSYVTPGRSGFRLWTFGWNSCQQWLFRCERRLEPISLRRALTRVMRRQPALRLRFKEQLEVQTRFMEAAMVLELLRTATRVTPAIPSAGTALHAVQQALQVCWPRWHTAPAPRETLVGDDIFIEVECATTEIYSTIKYLRRHFAPPFQLVFLRHPQTDAREHNGSSNAHRNGNGHSEPPCHVCVLMSHAIADGAAVVPLIDDLGQLCLEEEAQQPQQARPPKRRLQPLPHFGAILEDRLLRTLSGNESQGDVLYLDKRQDVFKHHFREDHYRGYCQTFNVLAGEARELKNLVDLHVVGCSMEAALLSMIVLSLARIEGEARIKFTLVHHGRDNPPCAVDVVGFFTDFRTVVVPTSELMSLLGVINFVSTTIRERSWRRPGVLEPVETLVNVVPSPFSQVGCLSQARGGAYGNSANTDGSLWQDKRFQKLRRPLEFQIEQVDSAEWNINMYLDVTRYPPEKGQRFRAAWLRLLRDLREHPLQGVLSSPGASPCDALLAPLARGSDGTKVKLGAV